MSNISIFIYKSMKEKASYHWNPLIHLYKLVYPRAGKAQSFIRTGSEWSQNEWK